MHSTTQLHTRESGPATEAQLAGELAACLARFLNASADERTLERAREALACWHRTVIPT